MFHTKLHPNADLRANTAGELALRAFLVEHDSVLGHTAVLLAARRGARLVNAIREGLDQPGPITGRLRCRLLELRGLLLLEHDHGEFWEAAGCFGKLDPEEPIVLELCLLADGLDENLRSAGIFPGPGDEHAA